MYYISSLNFEYTYNKYTADDGSLVTSLIDGSYIAQRYLKLQVTLNAGWFKVPVPKMTVINSVP